MKNWMWLALGGAVLYYLWRRGSIPGLQSPQEEVYGAPVQMPTQPPAGDDQYHDPGVELVEQLYGYSMAPRADQVRQQGTH